MQLLKAPRLRRGDKVRIIAPGSPPPDPKIVDEGLDFFTKSGYTAVPGRHLRKRRGFLAGTDDERLEDIHEAFGDPDTRAVFSIRGGAGSGRLLSRIDYGQISANPKLFIGCSDITALHCAIHQRTGLVTFHGPMPNSLVQPDCPAFTIQQLFDVLDGTTEQYSIRDGYSEPIAALVPGSAEGILQGGNLSVLCSMIGTPFQPDLRDSILFLEDIAEAPFRIDRHLGQLLDAGMLSSVRGFALGLFHRCEYKADQYPNEYKQTLRDVLQDRLGGLGVPMVLGLPFGHLPANAMIPYGVRALLDADRCDLRIVESPVG